MRKVLSVLALTVVIAAPLSAAQATTTYKVSVTVDPKLTDASSKEAAMRTTTIKGRVTNGPVKGRTVHLYATNTSAASPTRQDLGTVALSSTGRFAKKFAPTRGGIWKILADRPKYGSARAGHGTTTLSVFQWTRGTEFHDGTIDTPKAPTDQIQDVTDNPAWEVNGSSSGYGEMKFVLSGGGTTVGFDTRGHTCKKVSLHAGVADGSTLTSAGFTILQHGLPIGTAKSDGEDAYFKKDISTVYAIFFKVNGQATADDLKVLLGNVKLFCNYPSEP